MSATTPLTLHIGLACLLLVVTVLARPPAADRLAKQEQRIQDYRQQIAQHPRSWALYPPLAAGYLQSVRFTGELKRLEDAETLLQQSLAIQPNAAAFSGMAALYNYRHRFAQALLWAQKARAADPDNSSITGMLVEARLGLGERERAHELLQQEKDTRDFNLLAAWAQWHAENGQYDLAAQAYRKATTAALQQQASEQALWAIVNTAGMYLDSGRAVTAAAFLQRARAMQPDDRLLRIHEAEYQVLMGADARAYTIYAELIDETGRADLHARAYVLARKLGRAQQAQQHFIAAEADYLATIEHGEIFTLGALARLYCDAGRHPEQALDYARQNLEYKKDRQARKTLACAQQIPASGSE